MPLLGGQLNCCSEIQDCGSKLGKVLLFFTHTWRHRPLALFSQQASM